MTQLVFYDISSPRQPRSYAPNPSKARLALSFKGVDFKTEWVDLLYIEKVRRGLNCSATRKLDNGSDFFTLPMLRVPSTNTVLGDSFDIANYLDDTFPDSGAGRLFPPDANGKWMQYESPAKDTPFFAPITTNVGAKHEAYAKFNFHVDATFSAAMIGYSQYLPFNLETADAVKAIMCKRAHLKSWDDLSITGEARKASKDPFMENLKGLAECFEDGGGVYLEGQRPCYADLILGGWVNMLSQIMPVEEWEDFRTWHGGVFAGLHDELQEKYFVCT
ncbi:hypothetical protein BU23DRAFT_545654 [Bimuria novae-zelandiae CBS 107.79]|uniref:GST N-terminal domain-containing protein n=1 Tax=Bimuria novae-zelandiae CBS 107.79 TaxID=1447943 RepID=A0A6A5UL33_9PLEO|nr:hypothetical protein BU23DRAFT_545654 [Bimuria novae-zelandiae CBS 107.79]